MDATARCLTLAPLLWPAHDPAAFDVRLSRGDACISAALLASGNSLAVVGADDGVAALDALAATLATVAHDRSDDLLRAAGLPMPCADRFAEAEEKLLAAAVRANRADTLSDALRCAVHSIARGALDESELAVVAELAGPMTAAALRTLAARVDREPPQRAPSVVAGVADLIDAEVAHMDFVAGYSESPVVADVCRHLADRLRPVAIEARQRAGGGEGRGERVERGQEGAADVGGVAEAVERVVVADGRVTVGEVRRKIAPALARLDGAAAPLRSREDAS